MKYILQNVLKSGKCKDIRAYDSMGAADLDAINMNLRYEGTSYIGMFPQYSDGKGASYRIILRHEMGMICSPDKEDLSIFASVVA